MLRIGLVTHVVDPRDGQGRVNYELARFLSERGHHITLFASEVEPTLLRQPGVHWVPVHTPSGVPDPIRWLIFAAKVRLRLGRTSRRDFDILHLNGAIAPVPADVNTSHFIHASWRQVVATVGHRGLNRLYQRLVSAAGAWCERRAYASAGRVVAVSHIVRDALASEAGVPSDRIQVICNGVDLTVFRPWEPGDPRVLRGPLGLPPDAIVILFIGDARSPRKNLDLTLRAVARAGPRFHLVVVGRATGGPYLALAGRLGLGRRTHFLGLRADVADCLRDADVVLCPSHYEPASLVLLEAMASGLPVIATPAVGNAAFIADRRNGYLLRDGDDLDGAAQLLEILGQDDDLRRRIGKAARETAMFLGWKRMGRQYESLYLSLLKGRNDAAVARGDTPVAVPVRRYYRKHA